MTTEKKLLFLDARAGASGDMLLGALVDLGAPLARIRRGLATLPVSGWTLRSRKVQRCSLAARKIDVRVREQAHARTWRDLRRIVRAGELPPAVARRSLEIFGRLFEVEAEVHGSSLEKVHLHEAGAVDAIVDVVGSCIALDALGPEEIVVSTMTTGFGSVSCAHGRYPVPGPATLALVRGCPVRAGEIEVERLTPTGAAILTTVADRWGELPPMRPERVGLGAGDRELEETPNVLRAVLGTSLAPAAETDVVVLECTVDDSTPQAIAFAAERIRQAGALDLHSSPVLMKKGRSGQLLTVLCRPGDAGSLMETMLRETSSLGVRYRTERRVELKREIVTVRSAYGSIRVKLGRLAGEVVQAWPEYEDCAKWAAKRGVSLAEVQQSALETWRSKKKRK